MREVKIKPGMGKPKLKWRMAFPREAVRLLQCQYIRRKEEQQTQERQAAYPTEQIEKAEQTGTKYLVIGTGPIKNRLSQPKRETAQGNFTTNNCESSNFKRGPERTQRKQYFWRRRQQKAWHQTKSAARKIEQGLAPVVQAASYAMKSALIPLLASAGGTAVILLLALPLLTTGFASSPAGILTGTEVSKVDEQAMEVWQSLPNDLPEERRVVVTYALALVEKVPYFWGGKSLTLGWDDRWGSSMEITAPGDETTGTVRPFGLDCSGFVDWVFYNATGGKVILGQGGGVIAQHAACTDIPQDEAQPGDLVFYLGDEHVGIVVGRDESDNLLIAHCSGGQNGVAITLTIGAHRDNRLGCFYKATRRHASIKST